MSGDIKQFLQAQKAEILKETERLNCLERLLKGENKENVVLNDGPEPLSKVTEAGDNNEDEYPYKNDFEVPGSVNSGHQHRQANEDNSPLKLEDVPSAVEPLDLTGCYDFAVDRRKKALIDRLSSSEGPFSCRSADDTRRFGASGCGALYGLPLLRRGECAPSRYARLRAAPHEGLGEYEIGRLEAGRLRRTSSAKVKYDCDIGPFPQEVVVNPLRTVTDDLVDAAHHYNPLRVDQRLTTEQNDALLRSITSAHAAMDKPKGILTNRRTGSSRDRYAVDLGHNSSYNSAPYLDGFSYSDRSEELERERLKREAYQHELRLQIEEKRRLNAMRDEQDRHEREMENRRLEQQLMRMREEQAQEDQRRQRRSELMRRHSDDLLRRTTELHEMQRPWRRLADSESANLDSAGLGSSYSPPVARRVLAPVSPYSPSTSYNVPPTSVFPDSSISRCNTSRFESSSYPGGILRNRLTAYDTVPLPRSHRHTFDRFDSLSRIDSLGHRLETLSMRDDYTSDLNDLQRRHSATQQDLSRSPRLRRRNSSSRFDDALPAPLLKARSPVAKELRNAVPFSSQRSSDRWHQKGGMLGSSLESPVGTRGGILTQLGSIRAQLQREQLRMDESLRRRGLVRTRTSEDY